VPPDENDGDATAPAPADAGSSPDTDPDPDATGPAPGTDADTGSEAEPDPDADTAGAADADPDPDAADGEGGDAGERDGPRAREVEVPMRLYKTVTVMATLLAMVGVVGGFVLLDVATNRAQADLSEVDPVVALLGLGLIVGGAATYAYSTRFRAAGMGKDKPDEGEGSSDG
jgi:hypothetical protein